MRIVVFPRDANPYQDDLYCAMAALEDLEVVYLDGPTPSQTVNLLCLPYQLVRERGRGARLLHIHWVYPFAVTWSRRRRWARRLAQAWFAVVLATAEVAGYRIVWTAHNVVPHEQVFANDVSARRRLARHADGVIAHNRHAAEALRRFGGTPATVIAQGAPVPPPGPTRDEARCSLGFGIDERVGVCFGVQLPSKGADLLLEVLADGEVGRGLHIAVVGRCPDAAYAARLQLLSTHASCPVTLRLDRVDDEELVTWLAAADATLFPFRSVTNSSSVLYALAAGAPVVIPDMPELAELPASVAVRYPPDDGGLAIGLAALRALDETRSEAMAAAARRYAATRSWATAAAATWSLFHEVDAAAAHPVDAGFGRSVAQDEVHA